MPDDTFDEAADQTVVIASSDLKVHSVPAISEARTHVLVRMDGSDIGQVTTLAGSEIEMGRSPKSAVHLPFEGVSRQHARMIWQDGAYLIEDLESANGTFVKGTRVVRHRLVDGDVVQIGPRVVFRYSITDKSEERILRQLYESSVKDALTGAHNREYLAERLKVEVAYAKRHQTELSVLMMDVDHFKKVNDTYGHQAGDAVLVATAASLAQTLRNEDVLARYGGEEFLVILRGTGLTTALTVAERLRQLVEMTRVAHGDQTIRCTVSGGCASITCAEATSAEALVAIADRRLYLAKRAGRNRVVADG